MLDMAVEIEKIHEDAAEAFASVFVEKDAVKQVVVLSQMTLHSVMKRAKSI